MRTIISWTNSPLQMLKSRRHSKLLTLTAMGTSVPLKSDLSLMLLVRLALTKRLTRWSVWLTLMETAKLTIASSTRWRVGSQWRLWAKQFQCQRIFRSSWMTIRRLRRWRIWSQRRKQPGRSSISNCFKATNPSLLVTRSIQVRKKRRARNLWKPAIID